MLCIMSKIKGPSDASQSLLKGGRIMSVTTREWVLETVAKLPNPEMGELKQYFGISYLEIAKAETNGATQTNPRSYQQIA